MLFTFWMDTLLAKLSFVTRQPVEEVALAFITFAVTVPATFRFAHVTPHLAQPRVARAQFGVLVQRVPVLALALLVVVAVLTISLVRASALSFIVATATTVNALAISSKSLVVTLTLSTLTISASTANGTCFTSGESLFALIVE